MKTNWLAHQILSSTQQWDKNLTTISPSTNSWMKDDLSYFKHLTETCNYLKAVKMIDWDTYLVQSSVVLDIGCGGGWLTGFLSKNKKIHKIFSIDSSNNYLDNFLSHVVMHSGGDITKVEVVQGLFSPLLLEDESIDMIVISSALHHADNLNLVLKEFIRVLKPGAYLMILNETPPGFFRFMFQIAKASLRIFIGNLCKNYTPHSQKIGIGSYLYDPCLGDVDYPEWYWKKSIHFAGFDLLELLNTNLATIADSSGRSLKHFICKKPI